ncbi:hypothetical protein [Actinomadura oligospora]|uniref:hypothetical protein n=1 Tax=Actinomadura oligospora TaxID=111804 RepID=UPI000479404A|nr:hypothetical protein [Actinomadura oligospora]
MADITFEQLESKVRELAVDKPNHVYFRGGYAICRYNADDRQSGCIFGQAFAALGVRIVTEMEGTSIGAVLDWLGVPFSVEQGAWARIVQFRQDQQGTWMEAIREADAFVADL